MRDKVLFIHLLLQVFIQCNLLAGQNEQAEFRIDLNYNEPGNQNVTAINMIDVDQDLCIDLYMLKASNLDAYQFTFSYDPQQLLFCYFKLKKEVRAPGNSFQESNILLKNDLQGNLLSVSKYDSSGGCIGVTLAYPQTDSVAADGNGLLGTLFFKSLVTAPDQVPFSKVKFADNNGIKDVCSHSLMDSAAFLGGHRILTDLHGGRPENSKTFKLCQNFPNPFNSTNINFELSTKNQIQLVIYNWLGQKIRTLVNHEFAAGYHSVNWDSRDSQNKEVSTGVYIIHLIAEDSQETRNMLLLR